MTNLSGDNRFTFRALSLSPLSPQELLVLPRFPRQGDNLARRLWHGISSTRLRRLYSSTAQPVSYVSHLPYTKVFNPYVPPEARAADEETIRKFKLLVPHSLRYIY